MYRQINAANSCKKLTKMLHCNSVINTRLFNSSFKFKTNSTTTLLTTTKLHCVQKKNTNSHFLSYLHELFVDLNKNCSEYAQGLIDSDNVKIRYSLRSMT